MELNHKNSIQILIKYTELSQKNGTFLLQEADALKKAVDALNKQQETLDVASVNLLIQALQKGQTHGDYTLTDASLIYSAIVFLQKTPMPTPAVVRQEELDKVVQEAGPEPEFDLAAPIPLKKRFVTV